MSLYGFKIVSKDYLTGILNISTCFKCRYCRFLVSEYSNVLIDKQADCWLFERLNGMVFYISSELTNKRWVTMNKKTLAENIGIDTTNGYDTRCWDFETDNAIIFLIAKDELDIKNGFSELMYDVCENSLGGRIKRCELRQKNVLKVMLGKKRGYVLVRSEKLLEGDRDNHKWNLINGAKVHPVTALSMIMREKCGWVTTDTDILLDIHNVK